MIDSVGSDLWSHASLPEEQKRWGSGRRQGGIGCFADREVNRLRRRVREVEEEKERHIVLGGECDRIGLRGKEKAGE